MWSPDSATERRRYVERAELQMPVFFKNCDGGLGLSLEASTDSRRCGLRDSYDPAPLGQKTTTHIRIVVSMALVCGHLPDSNSFTINVSGPVIRCSSGKSQSVTNRARAIPSPWQASLLRSGELWIIFFRSIFRHHRVTRTELHFLGLRIRLYVCQRQRPTQTMADWARWCSARRYYNHRCRSHCCGELDADNATESVHFLNIRYYLYYYRNLVSYWRR